MMLSNLRVKMLCKSVVRDTNLSQNSANLKNLFSAKLLILSRELSAVSGITTYSVCQNHLLETKLEETPGREINEE